MHCHAHQENPAKHQETNKQTKPETNNQKPHTPMSGDVTSTSLWVTRSIIAGGDSLVSSRNMHNDILCAMMMQALTKKQTKQEAPQNHRGQFGGFGKQHSSMQKPCGKFKPKLVQKSFLRKSQDLHLDAVPTTYAQRSLRKRGSHTQAFRFGAAQPFLDALSEVL